MAEVQTLQQKNLPAKLPMPHKSGEVKGVEGENNFWKQK